jgi:predicted permease
MSSFLQDLRYALRQMRQAPGFAVSVVVVLALGIGANAAMFTVLDGTLFRPLAYSRPGELVRMNATNAQGASAWVSVADILVWRARARTLSRIAYFDSSRAYLRSKDSEQKVSSVSGSANLFATLGAAPALGRSFTEDEQRPGKGNVAVLSDAVWRAQFHGDPKIVGQTVRIDDTPTTVIGVMPHGFAFPADEHGAQIWVPATLKPEDLARDMDGDSFQVVARRRPGSSLDAVSAELNAIQKQLLPLYANPLGKLMAPAHVEPVDYRRSLNAKDQRTALLALLGAVAVLWLIACANVACLTLARTAARRREMAVRSALGASRWRLVRQTLVESLLLSLTGGAVGLLLSQATLRVFRHSLATQLSPELSLRPDLRVILALLALSVLSAVLFGAVPSLLASKVSVEQALRQDGAQAGTGRHQHRLQRLLVVGELSLTLAMLVSCGLLLRTVFALRQVPLGFRTDHVFVIEPNLPGYKYAKMDTNTAVYKPLLERLEALPGVESAALTTVVPLDKGHAVNLQLGLTKFDGGGKASTQMLVATLRASGPELQRVLGFSMARGRYFDAQDGPDTPLVAVVNKAFAKTYEPFNGDVSKFSLGMGGGPDQKPRQIKIVGVVDDLHQVGIAEPSMPEIDINAAQMRPTDGFYQPTMQNHVEIALRSSREARSLIPEVNRAMRELNPDLSGGTIRTMDQIVEDAMGSQLLAAHLLEALGGLALLVALAGLYSLLTYLVTLRTRELGLRLALGARREDILGLILRGAGVLLAMGTAVGLGISLLTARLLHSFLFGVAQYDAVTLVAGSAAAAGGGRVGGVAAGAAGGGAGADGGAADGVRLGARRKELQQARGFASGHKT